MVALQGQIKKLEPLLAALAAVPWIDPSAENGQPVPFIKTSVLDEVEGMGEHLHLGMPPCIWHGAVASHVSCWKSITN